MKKKMEFNDILNECIERVLKGEPIEVCLQSFPEHAAELEPLLRTAAGAHKAAGILPRPEFRQQAGYEFQAAIRDMKPNRGGFLRWQLRWVTAVSVVVAVLLAGSGTVAAANDSLPDESLYGVKLFTEEVRLVLTPSTMGKAQLYTEFTNTRVDEIIKMADAGKVEKVEQTAERMNDNLVAIARLIQPARAVDAVRDESQPLMAAAEAPASPVPAPEKNTATKTPTPALKPASVSAENSQRSVTSNASRSATVVKTYTANITRNRADLKTTVSRQAEKNTQDLQDVLQRAPESVKPALEKAIAIAEKGYEEALKNSDRKKK